MLLTHSVPHDIIVGELSPLPAHLGGLAERGGIEMAQDLETQFMGKGGKEVDLDEVSNGRGDKG